ncbi:C-type lectin domain-containing protein 180-like isoform X1 [Chenopodium quinoa]|uniref:C-type lectin domain-containing protein 180-like isoform X1 n=2 Tax=Chenopodium quinoa TaxID=63459 RepID=UPI000B771655|nr:C-type lectin domain-containing protein 180-like isoform X1 [Chenopodium quinoa]
MSEREVEEDSQMAAEKSRAVFVDTNLNTHLIVPIYSHSSVTSLKRQLRREHFECFPLLGRIEVNALSVKLNDSHYHLPDYMLLKTVFHGVADAWFVFADVWTLGSCLEPQKDIECKPLEARLWHRNELQLANSSPQPHVTLDMSSSKKKKKKKKRNDVEGIVENNNGGVKEQLKEKARGSCQLDVPKADKVSATKQLYKPSESLHYTSVVHPSLMHLKDGGDNTVNYLQKGTGMVHQLEGTSTNLAEVLNKESGIDTSLPKPRFKRTKKTKKYNIDVNNSPAATSNQEPDILERADAPSGNKHTIYKEGINIAEEVPPSQLNNVSELLFQHDPLKIDKETVEDVAPLKSDNAAKKRKRDRSGQERTAEKVTPLHLNNVPGLLLPQKESMNLVDREKEIEEDIAPVKSENPAKRRKRNKSKNSGTENQELLSKRQIADKKEHDMRTYLPDDASRPERCVETISETPKKRSRNEEAVPGKDPQEEIQKLEAPVTVIQSDKPKKQRQKKQPAPALDPSVDHHLDEITMEMEAPKKADAILTTCNAIMNDDLLKSDNTAKKSKTNESEQEHRTAAKVSQSHLNIAPDFSQNESVNFAEREKEIEEVVSPSKSEHSRKKKKERRDSQLKRKEISVLTESSKMQNDIDKPEESVETVSKSLKKRSLNEEAISSMVPPGSLLKEQPDAETRERAVPKTVIESDKPLTRSHRKKLSVSGKDLSSLAGKQQSAEKKMEMDAPKSVEEADDAKNQKKVIQGEVHHDDSREVPSLTVSPVLSESKHLEKSQTSKQKAKKT